MRLRLERLARVAALVIGLSVPALVANNLHRQYVQELAGAETRAANTARALDQHAARTFETIDTYLRAVAALVGPRFDNISSETVHVTLRDQFLRSRLNNIIVIDRIGRSIVEADVFPARALDVQDREYFQKLRDRPNVGLVIGLPLTGRLTGKTLIPVARRIDGPDGAFAGVVQAMLDPQTFEAVYSALDNGPGATLNLWRADGTLLVRSPHKPEVIGRNFADGTNYREHVPSRDNQPFWSPGLTDGIERVIAYSFLDGYPLYVGAALSRSDVLADWRRSAVVQASVAGVLTVVLVAALLLLAREIERRRGADAQILTSGERYRLLAESTTDVIIWSDLDTTRRYVSPAVRSVLGYEPGELIGTRPLDFVHPDDVEGYQNVLAGLTEGRSDQAVTSQRYRFKDGGWVWIEASFKLTRDSNGAPTGYVAALRNVTDRKAAEERLRLSEERLALALNSGSDGLWDWDLTTGAIQFSDHWFGMLGYEPGEIVPHISVWDDFIHPDDDERARRLMVEHVRGLTPTYECEYRMRRKTGGYVWTLARGKVVSRDETGRALRIVGTHMDITRRKEAERQIAFMAMHDGLTGLANRALFREKLEQSLASARRQGDCFAILACDLDRFKAVNDTLGHPAGDALLRVIADRLRAVVRDQDTVARLGGDEFAIIVRGQDDRRSVSFFAQHVIEAVGRPVDLDGHTATVSVSIGIALGTGASPEADILFKHADTALYRAKAVGRNGYSFYDPSVDAEVAKRSLLERDLRDAVSRGGFVLHYQPIVAMTDERVGGFEALLRWQHPTRGAISPAEFIPLAEETGLIIALGEWAIREACHEAASWPNDLRVAVNVSAVQFQQPGLEQVVLNALVTSGLPPHRLELEITESMLMQDSEAAVASLHRLKGLGVRIALDDFGTGFSSLSYLRRFPFDKIKIDRSFIRDIADPDTAAIVRAIVGIGARLGATVTAEGVETQAQLEQVRQEGCTEVQGFLYSKPIPAPEALEYVQSSQAGRRVDRSGCTSGRASQPRLATAV